MSILEHPPEGIIGTSTALIISPDFQSTLMAPHELKKWMPLGGKVEQKDKGYFDNALWRELDEEGQILPEELTPYDGAGNQIFWSSPVTQKPYHLKGKNAIDSLYIFVIKRVRDITGEKKCVWLPINLLTIDTGLSIHRMYLRKFIRNHFSL